MKVSGLAYRGAFYRVFRKDRHISSEGRGHRFESCRVRQFFQAFAALFFPAFLGLSRIIPGFWPCQHGHQTPDCDGVAAKKKPPEGLAPFAAAHSIAVRLFPLSTAVPNRVQGQTLPEVPNEHLPRSRGPA